MKWLNGYGKRSVLNGFIVSGFLSMVSFCSASEYVWTQKTDMPTPRWSHTSAVVNGNIYVIGGGVSEPSERLLSTVEEYDPTTDTWTRKADMPTERGFITPSSPVVEGRVYVIGGWGVSGVLSTVEEYDPATDTWTRKADMTASRYCLGTVAVGRKIYAIGGTTDIVTLHTVEEYDPMTDTWTRKADMPLEVWALCANVVNGKIYTIGGRPGTRACRWVQEYDPASDSWTRKADMPVATSQMASAVVGKKIIVVGGWFWSLDYPYTTAQVYDPETDTWAMEDDVPFLRSCFSASVVNNRIYVIGGTDNPHPCPALSTVYEYGPMLDFNWDGIVDSSDMCILIENWQTDNMLYDIAPLPFGDGIVDLQDLIELAEHFFEEISPVTLIGHWKLDEDEGDIAYDSIDDNHGILSGSPTWQTYGGQVAGALEFDRLDDYVSTEPVLNPADGVFSVIAWVQGGAPGQVVLSQELTANWLMVDADGKLMTELKGFGRNAGGPLLSEVDITDCNWHRIGLIWDGSYRHLYVDGVDVVRDDTPLTSLKASDGGLYLGAGSTLAPGTFFSGLIDDVRIYNRAVSP